MTTEKIYAMPFSKVYACFVAKAVRKGRTEGEVLQVVRWLTHYTDAQIAQAVAESVEYGSFFRNAPGLNPKRMEIHGSICGIKLDEIAEPSMRDIRVLDKLIDELAKGKPMTKILP